MDAPGLQQPEEGDFEGEQGGLGVGGVVQQGLLTGFGEHHLTQRPVQLPVEVRADLVQRGGEHGEGLVQFASHPGPLTALPREQEGQLSGRRRPGPPAPYNPRRGLSRGQCREPVQQALPVRAEDDCPVLVGVAGGHQGLRHGVHIQFGPVRDERPQPLGLRPQGVLPAAGDEPRHHTGPTLSPAAVTGRGLGRRHPLQDQVAIGAAHPEGADARERQPGLRLRPVRQRLLHAQVEFVQRDPRVRCLVVEAGRDLAPMEGQGGLEETDHSGGTLQVSHVRLGRADREGQSAAGGRAQDGAQGRGLDGVAEGGARAVQLHVVDVRRVDARPVVGQAEHLALRGRARHRESVRGAVVVDRAAADHAVDRVAVGQGPGEGLEEDGPAAFTADIAVGAGVEGVAAAVRRQPAEPVGGEGALRHDVEVHATRHGEFATARAQGLAGLVDGDEAGGLRGVHGETGTAQPEGVRHPVRDDGALGPGQRVLGDGGQPLPVQQHRVVVRDRTDEDPGTAAAHLPQGDAGVLESLPGEFQHEPLLGVHHRGFAWRYAEECGIECVHPVEKGAVPCGGGKFLGVPPVLRHFPDRMPRVAEQLPERALVGGLGESAGEPHYGDCVVRYPDLGEAVAELRHATVIPQ